MITLMSSSMEEFAQDQAVKDFLAGIENIFLVNPHDMKAVRETLIKVFTAADTGNVSDFNQVIQRRKQEAELRSLQILL